MHLVEDVVAEKVRETKKEVKNSRPIIIAIY